MDTADQSVGQIAFEAAREYQEGRDHEGNPLLYWRELTPDIKDTWETAALAVIKARKERLAPPIRLM